MYLLIFKTHVLGLLYVPDLDIFGEDVLGESSTSQADLDLAEMQSKFPPKKKNCDILLLRLFVIFLDEPFDLQGGKKTAYGKVEAVGQFFFSGL